MSECWLPVPGQEGRYEVSDLGRVRSLPRRGGNNRMYGGRILSPTISSGGYPTVALSRGNRVRIHVLVATAFIGERPPGHQVRHLDGNPQNNALANLAYGTISDNRRDSLLHGTNVNAAKTHCPSGHPYDVANTRYVQRDDCVNPARVCRACMRRHSAASKARREARLAS